MQRIDRQIPVKEPTTSTIDADYLRCLCGKIVSQITKRSVIIKCRHCKRFIVIKTDGVLEIEYQ